MKLYGFCSLLLCQIVSIFGASEKSVHGLTIERNGYVEYQSETSAARNDSFVLDLTFEPTDFILDWADLSDGISQTVRAIALVCMPGVEQKKEETERKLKPFFEHTAVGSLRRLKQFLKGDQAVACVHSADRVAEKYLSQLSHIKSIALWLECAGLQGSAQITYDSADNSAGILNVAFGLRDWYSSLHLTNSKPHLMGSVDMHVAQSGTAFQQEHAPDLHMLIFHRKPALVLQGEE